MKATRLRQFEPDCVFPIESVVLEWVLNLAKSMRDFRLANAHDYLAVGCKRPQTDKRVRAAKLVQFT